MADKGHFVWYELMTRNPNAALDFYGKVTGWGSTPWTSGDMPYTIFTRSTEDTTGVGGMMEMAGPNFPPEIPSHFMGYIATDDIDATAERATELGGTVHHGPADIPQVGRFAIIEDPQGAYFSLLQSLQPGEEKEPQLGDFIWNELMTTDYATAFDFYRELFGWQIDQDMSIGEEMVYRIFRPNGGQRSIGGIFTRPAGMPVESAWVYYVSVADITAAVDAVKENGGQILNGPMEVPGGATVAVCMDAEGTGFAVHAMQTAAADTAE